MLLASEDAARSDEAPTLHHSHGWSMPDITPEKVWGYQIAQGSRNVLNWLSSPSVELQTLRFIQLLLQQEEPGSGSLRSFPVSLAVLWHVMNTITKCFIFLHTVLIHTYCMHTCVHAHTLGGKVHFFFSSWYLLWIRQCICNTARDDHVIKRSKMCEGHCFYMRTANCSG